MSAISTICMTHICISAVWQVVYLFIAQVTESQSLAVEMEWEITKGDFYAHQKETTH